MSESAEFPWQHSFPPFYTLQPNLDSRKKQLEAWRSIILDYCQRKGLTSLDLREASNSELFNNTAIQRRLSDEALQGKNRINYIINKHAAHLNFKFQSYFSLQPSSKN